MNKPIVVKVVKSGVRFNALDASGTKYTGQITTGARKKAYANGNALEQRVNKAGKTYWWQVPMSKFEATQNVATINTNQPSPTNEVKVPEGHEEMVNFISSSYNLKPKGLIMSPLKWKYLIRSAVRGKNIMMTGPAGCVRPYRRSP